MLPRLIALTALAGLLALPTAAQTPTPPGALTPQPTVPQGTATPIAVLQGLDKVAARVQTVVARIDQPVHFGTLTIVVHRCIQSAPEAPPESAAFLEITDEKAGEEPKPIFTGWMFASSPALSAMENAVYDLSVVACRTTETADSSSSR